MIFFAQLITDNYKRTLRSFKEKKIMQSIAIIISWLNNGGGRLHKKKSL